MILLNLLYYFSTSNENSKLLLQYTIIFRIFRIFFISQLFVYSLLSSYKLTAFLLYINRLLFFFFPFFKTNHSFLFDFFTQLRFFFLYSAQLAICLTHYLCYYTIANLFFFLLLFSHCFLFTDLILLCKIVCGL